MRKAQKKMIVNNILMLSLALCGLVLIACGGVVNVIIGGLLVMCGISNVG